MAKIGRGPRGVSIARDSITVKIPPPGGHKPSKTIFRS